MTSWNWWRCSIRACSACGEYHPVEVYRQRKKTTCPACSREHGRARSSELRRAILDKLGGKCIVCGEDNPYVLHIDHVEEDGAEDRRGFMTTTGNIKRRAYMAHILEQLERGTTRYALLCANHNTLKEMERRRAYAGY